MISVESPGGGADVRSIVGGAEPEVFVVWAFGRNWLVRFSVPRT
jgi:hypothetical protein